MALKMDITTADDSLISNAYFKIMTTVIEWETNQCIIIMGAWKGRQAYLNKKKQLSFEDDLTFKFNFEPGQEPGTRNDIYTWLKTQTYFVSAGDALE